MLKTKTQVRVGFAFVAILAAASAILGFIQIKRTIQEPFLPKKSAALGSELTPDQRKEELKKLDTDKDGLSDYDEIYIYNTSAFIEDSDSDGASDKAEVQAGEDPNCPKGKNCFAPAVATSTPQNQPVINPEIQGPAGGLDLLGALGAGGLFPKGATQADLRQQLEQLGVPKNILDKIPDAELQKLYLDSLRETAATSTN